MWHSVFTFHRREHRLLTALKTSLLLSILHPCSRRREVHPLCFVLGLVWYSWDISPGACYLKGGNHWARKYECFCGCKCSSKNSCIRLSWRGGGEFPTMQSVEMGLHVLFRAGNRKLGCGKQETFSPHPTIKHRQQCLEVKGCFIKLQH